MNTIELKTNIFELVEKLDDIATLQAIRILLQKQLKISTTVDFGMNCRKISNLKLNCLFWKPMKENLLHMKMLC